MKISIDAMGGDLGPNVAVKGAAASLVLNPESEYIFFGDENIIKSEIEKFPKLKNNSAIVHTDSVITMEQKPSQAIRNGRGSSMWKAIEAVKNNDAEFVVSGGNTGALMAMAVLILKRQAQVERPAIAAIWPTIRRETIVLDVGANAHAKATQLVDFSVMGAAMASALFGLEMPKVSLLNIGEEEIKGIDEIKQAAQILNSHDFPLSYEGFIEGDGIGRGIVDVIVTDGFTGNIALKTAEGTARQIGIYIKDAFRRTWLSKIGALAASGALRGLKNKMDPRGLNGGVFLGLNGLVIKSHGGTDALGFSSAIDLGFDAAKTDLTGKIAKNIEHFHEMLKEKSM